MLVYNDPASNVAGTAQPLAQTTVNVSFSGSAAAATAQSFMSIPSAADLIRPGFTIIPTITGSSTGLQYVSLVVVSGPYSGPTDFGTTAMIGSDASTSSPAIVVANIPVINGQWQSGGIAIAGQPPASLSLLIYPSTGNATASSSQPVARTSIILAAASSTPSGGTASTTSSTAATALVDQAAYPVQATADATLQGVLDIPPLTGSATGENSLSVVVIPGQYAGPIDFNSASRPAQTASSATNSPLRLSFLNIPVQSGTWKTGAIALPLLQPPSMLTVLIYDYASTAASTAMPITESSVSVLPTVKPSPILSAYPSATVDQYGGTIQLSNDPNHPGLVDTPPFTGTAKNTQSVTIAVIPGSYSGATDFSTISHLSQSTQGAISPTFFLNRPVQAGRWQTDSIAYALPHPAALTILVYDAAAAASGTGEPVTSSVVGL